MSPQILAWIRMALPFLRWLASQTKSTADDNLVSLLESVVAAPTHQAAAMLAVAHSTAQHMATAAAAPAQTETETPPKGRKGRTEE